MEIESDRSKIAVTVEIWQNQNFWPVKGWSNPFFGSPHFVVHFAKSSIYSKDFPSIALPTGWEWADEWEVDMTQAFGSTDSDGWVYGTSFDHVVRSILNAETKPVPAKIYLCRKRRWRRMMMSSSPALMTSIRDRIDQIVSERQRIQVCMTEKQQLVSELLEYEKKRVLNDKSTHISILAPIALIEQQFIQERDILLTLKQSLVGFPEGDSLLPEITNYFESVITLLDDCAQEFKTDNDRWNKLTEDLSYCVMTIREKLETVLTNHVDDIAILSEELNFLRGAGSIGNLLPTGSKLHSTSKSKQRKISWDLPEIGDIWYNMKYYNQLVILIQDQLSESASGVAKLNERKLAHSNRLMEILRKFDNLYFKIFEQVKKSNPIIIDYMANKTSVQKTSSNESIKLANVPFFDTSNLPKLPSTLGIFTLMYASANSVKQSLITKLTPSSIIKNSIPDKKSRGAVILQGVTWCEVIIAISTDGFLHVLPVDDDFDSLIPLKSVAVKGSRVHLSSSRAGLLDTCVEIHPWNPPLSYIIYHRLLGRKIRRVDDGVVLCVEDPIIAQTIIELLLRCFLIHAPTSDTDDMAETNKTSNNNPVNSTSTDESYSDPSLEKGGYAREMVQNPLKSQVKQAKPTITTKKAETKVPELSIPKEKTKDANDGKESTETDSTAVVYDNVADIGPVFEMEITKELTRKTRAMSSGSPLASLRSFSMDKNELATPLGLVDSSKRISVKKVDTSGAKNISSDTSNSTSSQPSKRQSDSQKSISDKPPPVTASNSKNPTQSLKSNISTNSERPASSSSSSSLKASNEVSSTKIGGPTQPSGEITPSTKPPRAPKLSPRYDGTNSYVVSTPTTNNTPSVNSTSSPVVPTYEASTILPYSSGRGTKNAKTRSERLAAYFKIGSRRPGGQDDEDGPTEYDAFPVRFSLNKKSPSSSPRSDDEEPQLPSSARESLSVKRYTEGLRESYQRKSNRIDEVKSTNLNDLEASVSEVAIVKTSEPFRQKTPRSRSARTARPTPVLLTESTIIDSKKVLQALNGEDKLMTPTSFRSTSPTNFKMYNSQQKNEAHKRAESARVFRGSRPGQ